MFLSSYVQSPIQIVKWKDFRLLTKCDTEESAPNIRLHVITIHANPKYFCLWKATYRIKTKLKVYNYNDLRRKEGKPQQNPGYKQFWLWRALQIAPWRPRNSFYIHLIHSTKMLVWLCGGHFSVAGVELSRIANQARFPNTIKTMFDKRIIETTLIGLWPKF